jgi:uncharacterized repeat protein (TIGR01451 family)
MIMMAALIPAAIFLGGCTCPPAGQTDGTTLPEARVEAPYAANRASQDYVCPGCGAVRIEKVMPQSVQLNQPFGYTIVVQNLTDQPLSDVVVRDRLPNGFEYDRSVPEGEAREGVLTWQIDTLDPKATQRLVVNGSATEQGVLQTCADASYVLLTCAQTEVVQPSLAVTATAPASVLLCDPIPLTITVTNNGTGTASNVQLTDRLPENLTTEDGQNIIRLSLGNLNPQQSASRTVNLRASGTGRYTQRINITAAGDLSAESEAVTTEVTRPVLAIEKTGRESEYLGREVRYDITVANRGNAAAANTVITDTLPVGVTDVRANQNGSLSGNTVTWQIGSLAPNASKTVSVTYVPANEGTYRNTARATAVCAEAVSAASEIAIRGIPAILLEVVDVSDPIAVGQNETYVITVTNQGTATDTNIRVTATLEDSMEFVSAGGATNGTLEGDRVIFEPLQSLTSGAKATWRVVVKALEPADARFMVLMNSDHLRRDVGETEATNFYE